MRKSVVVYGVLFYSAWALQAPDSGIPSPATALTLESFKEQVGELQRFLFKVRGQLLGLELVKFSGSLDPEIIAELLITQLGVAYCLLSQIDEHLEWRELPEYTVLIKTIEQLNLFDRELTCKQECVCAMMPHINPFK